MCLQQDGKYKIKGELVFYGTREIRHEILINASPSAVYELEGVFNGCLIRRELKIYRSS
jgi:hypothetical protein